MIRLHGTRLPLAVATLVLSGACAAREDLPEDLALPELLTRDLPFRYPPELYASGVEGQVALHLFVDSLGLVVPESTRVEEPSAHPAFDSSAVAGAPYLEFRPAQRGSSRLGYAVVLPVQFRIPPKDSATSDTGEGEGR